MSLITVTAGKGAPGVTTTAVALAAVWPRLALLADCDVAGGDVALRLRDPAGRYLARDRGLVGLAAAARVDAAAPVDIAGQVQEAAGGVPVLVGCDSPTRANMLHLDWAGLAEAFADRDAMDVVADCGRLTLGADSEPLLARSQVVVVVTRAGPEAFVHLRHTVGSLDDLLAGGAGDPARRVVVIGADAKRDVADAQTALDSVNGVDWTASALPIDAAGAAGLAGMPTRALDRSPLVVAARELAADLDRAGTRPAVAAGDVDGVDGWVPDRPDAVDDPSSLLVER